MEVQFARAIRIARHAKVLGIADIRAEFDLVIALNARPVVHDLELIFLFGERAVATAHVQTVTERTGISAGGVAARAIPHTISVEMESGQAACCRRTDDPGTAVQTGHAESIHW